MYYYIIMSRPFRLKKQLDPPPEGGLYFGLVGRSIMNITIKYIYIYIYILLLLFYLFFFAIAYMFMCIDINITMIIFSTYLYTTWTIT